MSEPLVWLPFDPADLGEVPAGLRYEVVDPVDGDVPGSVGDVAFYVPPYRLGSEVADVLPRMSSLEVLQTLTAGVDNVRGAVPDGVTLCSGRGIHDTSTAELALTLTLASLRGVPDLVRAQERHAWAGQWRTSLADRRVLLVGHGAIGQAIETRLTAFEASVTRVARTARDGVHALDELPALLPDADVVILVVPLTDETRGLVDAAFLDRMKHGALLVNVARGPVVVTDDLLAALHSGRVTAALDVTDPEPLPADHPLWEAPGVLVSPHVGGLSSAMWPRAHRVVREQLRRYAAGVPLHNVMTGAY
ncbi:2-hydroxyacid dehydrogenase [Nocardioides dongxiaopingii]|uniref:2-hydroxyacid dehydrogenase n=1 Tax=Nocardioides sp. S-1144 TaxID=2582905 RepID=UPI00110E666D|nr:2-hydroxyacid dehydrogenase [Nocardioides sp. S-1144]QCW50391.1 2-hydroxyacid dehydrogenase [Nocardioides sp. S-1144]